MASRAERREAARKEAGFKLALIGLAELAFMIGGVSGFAGTFTELVFLATAVGTSQG